MDTIQKPLRCSIKRLLGSTRSKMAFGRKLPMNSREPERWRWLTLSLCRRFPSKLFIQWTCTKNQLFRAHQGLSNGILKFQKQPNVTWLFSCQSNCKIEFSKNWIKICIKQKRNAAVFASWSSHLIELLPTGQSACATCQFHAPSGGASVARGVTTWFSRFFE